MASTIRLMTAVTLAAVLGGAPGGFLRGTAAAGEEPVDLKAGDGAAVVEGNCGACHSLDYIRMNSPFLGPAGWEAEVNKMVNAYGAPISAADAKTIADYLKANYGK